MMATIMGCEENAAWQKSRELLREVYAVSNTGLFAIDFSLCERLRWSAISIVLSIADGIKDGTCDGKSRFMVMAQGAASEFLAALAVAMERRYLTEQRFDALCGEVKEITGLIGGGNREVCHIPEAGETAPDGPATAPDQKVETRIVSPGLFGWCREYSEATGVWGWKLRGFSNLN